MPPVNRRRVGDHMAGPSTRHELADHAPIFDVIQHQKPAPMRLQPTFGCRGDHREILLVFLREVQQARDGRKA